jgi:hypothetical protein
MNFEIMKELKKNIDNYYFLIESNDSTFDTYESFVEDIISKYKNIDPIIIEHLCKINKYNIDGNTLHINIELLKYEIIEFYKKSKNKEEKLKKNIFWLLKYSELFMKSDKLYIGLVERKLDYSILNNIIYNMKQMDAGNITKTSSDVQIGQILFDKYINIKEDEQPPKK